MLHSCHIHLKGAQWSVNTCGGADKSVGPQYSEQPDHQIKGHWGRGSGGGHGRQRSSDLSKVLISVAMASYFLHNDLYTIHHSYRFSCSHTTLEEMVFIP